MPGQRLFGTLSAMEHRAGTLRIIFIGALLAAALTSSPVPAAVPNFINFQGRLLAADGTPEAGILSVGFALYADASGGAPLWSETQTVAFAEGFYAVMLGSVSPLSVSGISEASPSLRLLRSIQPYPNR